MLCLYPWSPSCGRERKKPRARQQKTKQNKKKKQEAWIINWLPLTFKIFSIIEISRYAWNLCGSGPWQEIDERLEGVIVNYSFIKLGQWQWKLKRMCYWYLLLAEPNWKHPEGKGTKFLQSFTVQPSMTQSREKGRKWIWLGKQSKSSTKCFQIISLKL